MFIEGIGLAGGNGIWLVFSSGFHFAELQSGPQDGKCYLHKVVYAAGNSKLSHKELSQ